MEVSVFIENIQKAFGEKVQLPFAFWYSDKQINDDLKKINGCFFKEFEKLIGGEPISLSADRIGCMGGKFYTGFSTMNEKMPMFVSSKEKYKKSSLYWLKGALFGLISNIKASKNTEFSSLIYIIEKK